VRPFIADLSRALLIHHALDFVRSCAGRRAEHEPDGIRFRGRHARFAGRSPAARDEVVDTGLTMGYLSRTLALREPASFAAITLFDWPYRRLVADAARSSASLSLTSSSSAALTRRALAQPARPAARAPQRIEVLGTVPARATCQAPSKPRHAKCPLTGESGVRIAWFRRNRPQTLGMANIGV
jgi:hypothetical protein